MRDASRAVYMLVGLVNLAPITGVTSARALDRLYGVLQLAVVVGRHFGNDIRGGAKANLGAVNLHMDRIHVYFSDDARPRGRIR